MFAGPFGLDVQELHAGAVSAVGILIAPGDGGAARDLETLVTELSAYFYDRPRLDGGNQSDAKPGVGPIDQIRGDVARIPHAVSQFDSDHAGRGGVAARRTAALISFGCTHRSFSTITSAVPGVLYRMLRVILTGTCGPPPCQRPRLPGRTRIR